VLEGDNIVARALEMGVKIVDNKLEKVAMLKELEKARQALDRKANADLSKNELITLVWLLMLFIWDG
jgi:hypothetical protein